MKSVLCSWFIAAVWMSSGQAADKTQPRLTPEECNRLMKKVGKVHIVSSGRDSDVLDDYAKDIEALMGKGGVADQFGIALPPHVVQFMKSSELAVHATIGRYAIGHSHDGEKIANEASGAAGVLEFVTPGCPTCRSYYRDTTTVVDQREVFVHVLFHNHFAMHSMWNHIRPSDAVADSLKLNQLIVDLYQRYDHDEVAQWYQYLITLAHQQDLIRGTFDDPSKLTPPDPTVITRINHSQQEAELNGSVYGNRNHPKRPTQSILQAVVANLPSTLPQWKRDVALLFERVQRVYGYYAMTKIMNEGWATFGQDLLSPWLPWIDQQHAIERANLLRGVAYPQISNPYWLGREAWRSIFRRFKAEPAHAQLSQRDLVTQFLRYAETLIKDGRDFQFIRMAFDEQWIRDNGLFLYRSATPQELDRDLAFPNDPNLQNPEQKVVVSEDPKRVRELLARRLADRSLVLPAISLQSFNARGGHYVELKHEVQDGVPLERMSAAKTLYVMTKILRQPISIETVMLEEYFKTDQGELSREEFLKQNASPISSRNIWPPDQLLREARHHRTVPIRIEVEPSGAHRVIRLDTGQEIEAFSKSGQLAIAAYKIRSSVSMNEEMLRQELNSLITPDMAIQISNAASQSGMSIATQTPTAARALLEYIHQVNKAASMLTFDDILKKARVTNGRVFIQATPEYPEFRLDSKARNLLRKEIQPARPDVAVGPPSLTTTQLPVYVNRPAHPGAMDWRLRTPTFALARANRDDDVDLGSSPSRPRPGDKFWGNAEPEGEGEGEGDEDGDGEGEGENPGNGKKGGSGGGKEPGEIEIPLEVYGQILASQLELPRLRPKAGGDPHSDSERIGSVQKSSGKVLWNKMIGKLVALGEVSLRKQGLNPDDFDRRELVEEGFKLIQPSDYIVADRHEVPRPDQRAVVVIYMDMTGSMSGEPLKRAKELVFNLRAILKTRYKSLEFRFVGFADKAKEIPEAKFFKSDMGGGTNYEAGLTLTRQILESYDPAQFDRFSFGLGDAQDGGGSNPEPVLRDILKLTQFSYFVHTDNGWGGHEQFMGLVQSLAGDPKNYFDTARTDSSPDSSMQAILHLFRKGRETGN